MTIVVKNLYHNARPLRFEIPHFSGQREAIRRQEGELEIFGFLDEQIGDALFTTSKDSENAIRNGIEHESGRMVNALGNMDKLHNHAPLLGLFAHDTDESYDDCEEQVKIADRIERAHTEILKTKLLLLETMKLLNPPSQKIYLRYGNCKPIIIAFQVRYQQHRFLSDAPADHKIQFFFWTAA